MNGRAVPVTRHLSLIYRSIQRFYSARLRDYPLDAGQLPFLLQLFRTPGITQEQLSQAIAIDKGTAARSVALLLKKGLLQRRADPSDRRVWRLFLTERAYALEGELLAVVQSIQSILFDGMNEQEREAAFSLIQRMGENIKAYFERHPTRCAQHAAEPQESEQTV